MTFESIQQFTDFLKERHMQQESITGKYYFKSRDMVKKSKTCKLVKVYTVYDSPVKTPLFSKANNNAQKFDYRMSILGFCAASFWYKSVIFLCNLTTG